LRPCKRGEAVGRMPVHSAALQNLTAKEKKGRSRRRAKEQKNREGTQYAQKTKKKNLVVNPEGDITHIREGSSLSAEAKTKKDRMVWGGKIGGRMEAAGSDQMRTYQESAHRCGWTLTKGRRG